MDKKLFVFLFPEMEYMKDLDSEVIKILNEAIRERYIEKGFDFIITKYKNSDIFGITEKTLRIIDADITFEESTPYKTKNWKYADFKRLADLLNPKGYAQIRIGGFHCFDCVKKLALALYEQNKEIIIDTDLTEFLKNRCVRVNKQKTEEQKVLIYERNPIFNCKNYNIEKTFEQIAEFIESPFELEMVAKTYGHPIFGMKENIKNIEEKFMRSQREEPSTPIKTKLRR